MSRECVMWRSWDLMVCGRSVAERKHRGLEEEARRYVLLLSDALPDLVESIAHYDCHAEEIICWSEATGGEVALELKRLVSSRMSICHLGK